MNREQILRTIMAIIYRGGHWSNQAEKFDEILLFVHDELGTDKVDLFHSWYNTPTNK